MADILEIVKVIKQAAADAKDHPYGGKETGALQREKGHTVNDSRVVDGFSVSVGGDRLTLNYELECKMKDTHANGFETDIESTIEGLISYLKKEYKSTTKSALTLTADGEMDVLMQEVSRVRVLVRASKNFIIGGAETVEDARIDRKKRYDDLDVIKEKENYKPELAWKRYLEQD